MFELLQPFVLFSPVSETFAATAEAEQRRRPTTSEEPVGLTWGQTDGEVVTDRLI